MNTQKSSPKWVTLLIVGLIFFSPAILQGCDSFGVSDGPSDQQPNSKSEVLTDKFRHAGLLDAAKSQKTTVVLGKNGEQEEVTETTVHLVIGLNEYAGYDVTRRMINKYDVTRRMINKYDDDVNVKAELENAINAITVEVNESILDSLFDDLRAESDVEWVEPDIILPSRNDRASHADEPNQLIPWGVADVGAFNEAYSPGRVQVYILDSGVSETNELNIASSVDLVEYYDSRGDITNLIEKGSNRRAVRDKLGHGIAIAGTIGARHNGEGIVGVAPGAFLHSVKVLGKDGGTDVTTLLLALDYVVAQRELNPDYPFVVNLSLGANIGTTAYNSIDEAVAKAIEQGIVFVIAAGNEGIDASTVSPAHVADAITVGAYGHGKQYASFSNYGSVVDIFAPGIDVVSLARTYPENQALMASDGTSHAAPHVTGAVVRFLNRNPRATPREVEQALMDSAIPGVENVPANTTNKAVFIN